NVDTELAGALKGELRENLTKARADVSAYIQRESAVLASTAETAVSKFHDQIFSEMQAVDQMIAEQKKKLDDKKQKLEAKAAVFVAGHKSSLESKAKKTLKGLLGGSKKTAEPDTTAQDDAP
ncbi:hypothetical protein KAH55_00795, partial [bacterium]|nr:hypothetical protein [bacterium]